MIEQKHIEEELNDDQSFHRLFKGVWQGKTDARNQQRTCRTAQ
jgi:hypothetical protein